MRGKVYIENSSLEKVITLGKGMTYEQLLENGDRKKLLDLIFENNQIYINLSAEEVSQMALQNPYYRKLIRNNSLKFCTTLKIDKNPDLNPNLLYFLSKAPFEVAQYEKEQGLWFFSDSFLESFKYPVSSKPYNFNSENRFKDFDFLHRHKHPINSLIIADDYLFNDSKVYDRNSIELNLKPILNRLLPKTLEEIFHLTIISGPNNVSLDVDLIRSEIANVFKGYNYKYEFEFFPYNFHTRVLLTNYVLVSSDKGFRNLTLKNDQKRWCEEKNDFKIDFIHDSENNANNYYARISELRHLVSNSQNRLLKTPG